MNDFASGTQKAKKNRSSALFLFFIPYYCGWGSVCEKKTQKVDASHIAQLFGNENSVTLTKEEETVIGEIGAVDNTKSALQLETRYLRQASRLSFTASRSLTFQSERVEHQKIWVL